MEDKIEKKICSATKGCGLEKDITEFHDGNTLHIDSHPGFGEKALLLFLTNPHLSQE